MSTPDLSYIEDAHNRRLYYRFTPAAFASNFVPLIVVLQGEDKAEALHFEYKMWNVLTPLDTFSDEEGESYWLGKKGDLFLKDLLQELIQQIAQEYECEEHIYLYGGGTGAYGAILHGILCKANAVFAHSPRTRLPQTGNQLFPENDLCNFLNPEGNFPIFYLCEPTDSVPSSDDAVSENETASFADACKRHGITIHLDFCPDAGEDKDHRLKKVLNMFEHVPQ